MAKKKPTSNKKVVTKKKSNTPKKDYEVGKGKPPKHTQWKKGQTGNPNKIYITPEKRALKELSAASVADAITKTLTCTEEEVQALIDDPQTSVGHKVILRAALQAAHHGEYGKFDHILERAIGKVSVNINMNSNMNISNNEETKQKVKEIIKEVENDV